MAWQLFKRRDKWRLRPSDLPPPRALRAAPKLEGLADNPLFRWLHLEGRSGRTGKASLSTALRRSGVKAKLESQLLHDLWMTGVQPTEIAAAIWGFYSAARFRNMILGIGAAVLLGWLAMIGAAFFRPIPASALESHDVAVFGGMAVAYIQGAFLYHHWLALNIANVTLKAERDRWARRASLSREIRRHFKLFLVAILGIAGCAALLGLVVFAAVKLPLATFWESFAAALRPVGVWMAGIAGLVPRPMRSALVGVIAGSAFAHIGGFGARRSSRKTFAQAVKHAEDVYQFWLEVGESKPAAAPPGR